MNAAEQAGAGTQGAARRLLWWIVVPVLALLAVLTLLQYRQRLADAERDLQRRANERAQELEAIARPAMAYVHDLRRLLELNWDAPPDAGPALRNALTPRPLPPPAAAGAIDGWSLDAAPEALRTQFGQVWWAPLDARPPENLWLRRAEIFLRSARVVHERAPGFEATWFVASADNVSFGYPWADTTRMLAAMGLPTLQAVDKPRADSFERAAAKMLNRPDVLSFWGVPYVSQLDGELVQSHGSAVMVAGRYVGEVSLDFRLDSLQRIAQNWQESGTRVWVADTAWRLLADATQPLRAPAGQGLADTQVDVPLASRLPWPSGGEDLAALQAQVQAQRGALLRTGDWVLVTASRAGSPWLYAQAVPAQTLRAQVLPTLLPNALLALALLLVFGVGQWLFSRWFVTPSLRVLGYLRARSTDPQAAVPQLGERWKSWVDAVTDTFEAQRLLQQRERATEAFKSAMVDHAPLAIVTTDGAGRIVDFNPAAETLLGVPRAQALGQDLNHLILPVAARDGPRRLASGTHQARHSSGREFPMQLMSFRVQIEGEPFDTAFITDLSNQYDAAAQIDRQRDALRQSEKLSAMGTLLAGVAHELNNPLAIVMGRASLLEEKAEGTAAQDDARRIREAAERCGRIVRTFLNMARQKPPLRSAVQINDTVRAAVDMLGYTLRSHGIQVELQLADGMPDVQADADQLGQVVLNLMVNAQQAMENVQTARVLSLSTGVEVAREAARESTRDCAAGREPRVWLRVVDTGHGVPQAARDRLFEPFFTTKAAGFGTGLGLSVSRSIVREHGGDLVLEPRQGGAVFRMSLPISGGVAPLSAPAPLDTTAGELHQRVLVVDDEMEIADLMRAVLEGAGFDVATAESGAVALELLAEARFDAIVSDVRMPDIDGAALWRAVRDLHPALARRMLFVSGDTLSSQARQVLEETRCPSLDKPFARGDLLAAVREVLGR